MINRLCLSTLSPRLCLRATRNNLYPLLPAGRRYLNPQTCLQPRFYSNSSKKAVDSDFNDETAFEKANQPVSVGINWKAVGLLSGIGSIAIYLLQREKSQPQIEPEEPEDPALAETPTTLSIGGPFNLIDQHGNPFSEKELLGKFSLLYFGFSRCPDICPDELDKMAEVLNTINKTEKNILPVFITCDPARDSPEVLKEYLEEFHKDIIGLTGTYEAVKDTCKVYRVYFSTPAQLVPGGEDYLVDHSVFFYLMNPEGKYMRVFGRQDDAQTITTQLQEQLTLWDSEHSETGK